MSRENGICRLVLCLIVLLFSGRASVNATESLQIEGEKMLKHFKDYCQSVKTFKFVACSYDVDLESENGTLISEGCYDFQSENRLTKSSVVSGNGFHRISEVLFQEEKFYDLIYTKNESGNKHLPIGNIEIILRDRPAKEWRENLSLPFCYFSFSEDHVAFWEIIKEAVVLEVTPEQIGEESLVALHLKWQDVTIKLLLCPSFKYSPRRIEIDDFRKNPNEPYVRFYGIEYSDYKCINDIWFPHVVFMDMKAPSVTISVPKSGGGFSIADLPEENIKRKVVYETVKINDKLTEDDFSFSFPVPDGTKVFDEHPNNRHIEYVWLDGKIVPKTDEVALAMAKGHGFMPGPKSLRFWFVLPGLLMIMAACGLKSYKYFKSRGAE